MTSKFNPDLLGKGESDAFSSKDEEVRAELVALLKSGADREALLATVSDIHAADLADLLDTFPDEHIATVMDLLNTEETAEVLSEVSDEQKEDLIEILPDKELASIIEHMPPDEAAETLDYVDEARARAVLHHVEDERADDIRELRTFQPETAGRIMNTEYFAISPSLTVAQALDAAKKQDPDIENLHDILVVDAHGLLLGTLEMQQLISAPPQTTVQKLMESAVIFIHADRDQEIAAHMMEKYNLKILPVVGNDLHLLGIITYDDVMEILEDEAEEDIYRLAGIGADEPLLEGVLSRAYKRLPWLTTTVVGGLGLAVILSSFQPTWEQIVPLVFFIPLIAGLSGNVGIQSSTITVRGLAVGEVAFKNLFWLLKREMTVGLIIGLVYAVVISLAAHFFLGQLSAQEAETAGITHLMRFCGVLALAVSSGILVAAAIGTLAPLFCHRLGFDPAIAAGPFVTVVIDITTQTIYLTMATILLL
ncbi:MAG: magnesium transporter [Planctomycetes bacterium]|nr:magnesium transporter [Planctomycetota bacterium]